MATAPDRTAPCELDTRETSADELDWPGSPCLIEHGSCLTCGALTVALQASVAAAPDPLPLVVKRYQCPFCRRSRSARRAAEQHIARCWLNPAARACKTCAHFSNDEDYGPDCGAGVDLEKGLRDFCPLWRALPEGNPDGDST